MRAARHRFVLGVGTVWLTVVALGVPARAVQPAPVDDPDVDDPKMARVYQAPRPPVAAPALGVRPVPGNAAKAPPSPRPQTAAPTVPKVEPAKPAAPRLEVAKPMVPKVEPAKPTAPRLEVAKPVVPKVEPAKPVAPRVEVAQPAPVNLKPLPARAEPPRPAPIRLAELAAPTPAPAVVVPPARVDENPKTGGAAVDVAARDDHPSPRAERPAPDREWPYAPRLKLAYRRFPFTRVAAPAGTAATTPTSTAESFESLSLDLYPMSWFLRVGLSTQFGWESDKFDRSGDYFFAESASVGFQWPGRFTPFVEGLAGAGYMRRVGSDWNLPTAYWQVGIDAGVEIYLAKRAYVSIALGYLHPGNLFLMQQSLMSVKTDSWSLKFGVGI